MDLVACVARCIGPAPHRGEEQDDFVFMELVIGTKFWVLGHEDRDTLPRGEMLHGEQLVAKNNKDARSVLREDGVRRVCFHRILVTRLGQPFAKLSHANASNSTA